MGRRLMNVPSPFRMPLRLDPQSRDRIAGSVRFMVSIARMGPLPAQFTLVTVLAPCRDGRLNDADMVRAIGVLWKTEFSDSHVESRDSIAPRLVPTPKFRSPRRSRSPPPRSESPVDTPHGDAAPNLITTYDAPSPTAFLRTPFHPAI